MLGAIDDPYNLAVALTHGLHCPLRPRQATFALLGACAPIRRSGTSRWTSRGTIGGMRLGIAHHLGWAVAVAASADHKVVDRRRIELIEPGVPTAPIHHEGGPHLLHRLAEPLDDNALAALVADVRASVVRATSAALDEIATALPEPIVSMSLRAWPADFPEDIAVQRHVPYESRADSVMYRQMLAKLARDRRLGHPPLQRQGRRGRSGSHPG